MVAGPQQAGYHRLRWDGRDDGGSPLGQRRVPMTGDGRRRLNAQAHAVALIASCGTGM